MRLLLRRKSEANIASYNLDLPFAPLKGDIKPELIERILWADYLYGAYSLLGLIWLALEARRLEPASCRTLAPYYIGAAKHSLNSILRYNLTNFRDSVSGSFMLAWLEYSSSTEEADTGTYLFMSFAFLCDSRVGKAVKFGPFILDCINSWIIRNGEVSQRFTTFSQRVSYIESFRYSDDDGIWHSALLEAANSTLGNLMEVSLTWTFRFAQNEANWDFTRHQGHQLLQYIRSELGDVDLQDGLGKIYRSFQGVNMNHTTVEGQLITRLFHRLRCSLLLHAILEADSIRAGVSLPNTIFIAKKVISFCRMQVIRRDDPIEDYYLLSWHNFSYLMLGAMVLPEDCLHSESRLVQRS